MAVRCTPATLTHCEHRAWLQLLPLLDPSHLAPAFPVPDLTFCTATQRRWIHPARCLLSPDTPTCTVSSCKQHSSRDTCSQVAPSCPLAPSLPPVLAETDCATQPPAAVVAPLRMPRTLQPGETTTLSAYNKHSPHHWATHRRRTAGGGSSSDGDDRRSCLRHAYFAHASAHTNRPRRASTSVPRHRAPVWSGRPTPSTRPEPPRSSPL
jgi:hypothetical protein